MLIEHQTNKKIFLEQDDGKMRQKEAFGLDNRHWSD